MEHVVYIAPNLGGWKLSKTPNTYTKELVYVGDFVKDSLEFSIDEPLLHHWVSVFNDMKTNGVEVPVPVEHTQDPEKRRGTLISLSVSKNKLGVPALFGEIQFANEESASLADTAQTSIYVPPEFQDGKGHKYVRPIQHVALTDYPVVPGLEKFQVIAASLKEKEIEMSLKTLIEKLGLKVDETADDKAMEAAIVKEWKALKNPPKKEKEEPPKEPTVSAGFVRMAKENRQMKLDTLVQCGHITPAVSKKLGAQYCTDDVLALSLSSDSSDGFDELVDTLKENDPTVLAEQTGPQDPIALSNLRNDGKDNPLVADAKKRAGK